MTTPPLLNYAYTTTPVPLQINATGAGITVVASNPGIYSNDASTNYVEVTSIVISFGAPGTGGSALTSDPSGITHAAPDGWSVDVTGLQFTFKPPTANNGNRIFPSDGLEFSFSGIAINGATGTVDATVNETASSPGGTPPTFYPPQPREMRTQIDGLGKFPAEFSIQSFSASPAAVAPGGATQLAWVATTIANSSFSLIRTYQGQVETITQHGNGTPLSATDTYPNPGKGDSSKLRINGSTTFTLQVVFTSGGDVIQAQDQFTVNVPAPTIDSFTATPATGLAVGDAVTLSWATVAAELVTISPPLDGLHTETTLTGNKTVFPLDFTRYRLTASGQGLNVSQSVVLFPMTPGWTTQTSKAPWAVNQVPMLFALDDILYLYPGQPGSTDNPAYSSPDGKNWLLVNPNTDLSHRTGAALANSGSSVLVMGGIPAGGSAAQDVWATTNGVTWDQITSSAAWSARSGAQAIYRSSKYWLMGGKDSANRNDVWSSPDGNTWTQATAAAAWPARSDFSLVEMGGKLYLFGGNGDSGLLNDLWTSTDAISWTEISIPPFGDESPAARSNAVLYGLSSKLMLYGGTGAGGALNDCWFWDSSSNWVHTNGPSVPAGAANFAATQYNGGNWLMGGSVGTDFGKGVWVYAE
ncbi:Kelch repeat-containing protein [Hoeflea ulvae]|uniref:Uncharacterized protein n=1 Tax=Hoeflea ulvae TaxID=2983764 RepID=A0ABT3YG71_9HYPH|nr:kelch repeat-containing protein [Hoeflea ulvae]MCY0094898.1 hypothetical protein [Hoeflea ulvae]